MPVRSRRVVTAGNLGSKAVRRAGVRRHDESENHHRKNQAGAHASYLGRAARGPLARTAEAVRMRSIFCALLTAALVATGACAPAATDVAVPASCTPSTNDRLARLIAEQHAGAVDNVMVCGTTIGPSRPQRRGAHGGHQLIPLRVPFSHGSALVEVVTNDDLDGRVTAPRGATVVAYGQYFRTTERQRPFVAGVHDVHCATHRGADNGWVAVDGTKYPQHGC